MKSRTATFMLCSGVELNTWTQVAAKETLKGAVKWME